MSCNSTFTTPSGLQFSTYCESDMAFALDDAGANSLEECLQKCSLHSNNPCGAAVYDPNRFKCFFKGTNATLAELQSAPGKGMTVAIANRTQLQPLPRECTNNGQKQTSKNGLEFLVYCDQGVNGLDLCSDASPGCRSHANSLGECLDRCSSIPGSLCTGVGWDPILRNGYTNCFPKKASALELDNAREASTFGGRFAKALIQYPADECRSKTTGTILTTNQDRFTLTCDEDRPGNNITTIHSNSLDLCIDSCAKYKNPDCVGAVFDANMTLGYENCYLKSAIGQPTLQMKGFAFASRQASNGTTSSDKPGNPPATSKAWIAGPVIGGILAIAVIMLFARWWRNRGRSKEIEEGPIQEIQTKQPFLKSWLGHRMTDAPPYVHELPPDSAAAPKYEMAQPSQLYEMDSTTNGRK